MGLLAGTALVTNAEKDITNKAIQENITTPKTAIIQKALDTGVVDKRILEQKSATHLTAIATKQLGKAHQNCMADKDYAALSGKDCAQYKMALTAPSP